MKGCQIEGGNCVVHNRTEVDCLKAKIATLTERLEHLRSATQAFITEMLWRRIRGYSPGYDSIVEAQNALNATKDQNGGAP